jgi:hypothetical protein
VHAITAPNLRLDHDGDQARLRRTLDRLRPKLLVLDPLVRLHACDENSSQEIAGLLGYLRDIQRCHHVAIILVHHLGKKSHGQLGQSLRGSGDLHAWGDDFAYLTRKADEILLTLEHRSAPTTEPIKLRLVAEPSGVQVHLQVAEPIEPESSADGVPVSLAEHVMLALVDALADLEHRALVARTSDGWAPRSA